MVWKKKSGGLARRSGRIASSFIVRCESDFIAAFGNAVCQKHIMRLGSAIDRQLNASIGRRIVPRLAYNAEIWPELCYIQCVAIDVQARFDSCRISLAFDHEYLSR